MKNQSSRLQSKSVTLEKNQTKEESGFINEQSDLVTIMSEDA